MKTIIYHDDVDGITAAWAVTTDRKRDRFVCANYGEAPPDVYGQDVVIVDFSYPREKLLAMREQARTLLVYDHHKTAKEDLAGLPWCFFDESRSGAGLAWDAFHETRPRLVSYVEDRDLWKFTLPESRAINALINARVESQSCVLLAFAELDDLLRELDVTGDAWWVTVDKGRVILQSVEAYVLRTAKQATVRRLFGFDVAVVNCSKAYMSEVLHELANPVAMGWFQLADGSVACSLRGNGHVDVSRAARKMGGGGHPNAAGFELPNLASLEAL